jgi:hypothetical protein
LGNSFCESWAEKAVWRITQWHRNLLLPIGDTVIREEHRTDGAGVQERRRGTRVGRREFENSSESDSESESEVECVGAEPQEVTLEDGPLTPMVQAPVSPPSNLNPEAPLFSPVQQPVLRRSTRVSVPPRRLIEELCQVVYV